jgi:hypothetical protein
VNAVPLIVESCVLVGLGIGFMGLGSLNRASQERWRTVLLVALGIAGVALCTTVIIQEGA